VEEVEYVEGATEALRSGGPGGACNGDISTDLPAPGRPRLYSSYSQYLKIVVDLHWALDCESQPRHRTDSGDIASQSRFVEEVDLADTHAEDMALALS
jgi:hypothetical protein